MAASEVARSIQRDRDAIDRLVTELHGSILQLRMVPVAQLFRSFPRLVRDIARQLDKKVTLVTRGETTEADKTIVDRLFEPMVHLVRNALDHGIENPGQRRAAGKSEAATISIAASRSGDRLVVEVTDDGRGIDPALVRRKASEKRILPADELAALTDEASSIWFSRPDFRRPQPYRIFPAAASEWMWSAPAIEQIGGRVSLESKVGIGTTVRLDLPMTIAMSRIMVVEAGGQLFGIAMEAVSETVRVPPDRISRIKNNDGFVLRDRVVPIISLAELMKLPGRKQGRCRAKTFGRHGSCRQDSRLRDRRGPRPPGRGAQADAGAAVRGTRLCRNDIAGQWTGPAGAGREGDTALTIRRSDKGIVILDGVCAVEDAEPLLQMLQATPACGSRLDTVSPTPHGRTSGHHGVGQSPRSDPAGTPGCEQWLAPKLPQNGTAG